MVSDDENSENPFDDTEKNTELSHKVDKIYASNDRETPNTAQNFHDAIIYPTFKAFLM